MTKAEAVKKAEELLPCEEWGHRDDDHCHDDYHVEYCAAFYRTVVAAALLSVDEAAEKRGYAKGVGAAVVIADEWSVVVWDDQGVKVFDDSMGELGKAIRVLLTEPAGEQCDKPTSPFADDPHNRSAEDAMNEPNP